MATGVGVRYLSLLLALWIPATAQVAPMLNLVVLEGEGATNNIRQRTARDPVVQVEDENHKPDVVPRQISAQDSPSRSTSTEPPRSSNTT